MNPRPLLSVVSLFCLLTPAAFCADAPTTAPAAKTVVVVFKTHFDIGYTDLARNVVERYRTSMIDKALDLCDRSRDLPADQRFVWTVPGWPMAQLLWPEQDPARRERILQAVRDGRLVWHALPFTLQTEALDPENVVRGLQFSTDLSRSLNVALPRDAKMTDVPSHSWLIPTVLKRAGIDFLHIGCNRASASPQVPRLFWWEGPDGSRLLTMYDPSYGSDLVPPRDWPCKTWLAMLCTGDNIGPPAPGDIDKLLQRARTELPGVKVRFGRLSDFANAILEEKPSLPVVRGDMPDTWIQGIMAMPVETALARQARASLGTAESLNMLLRLWHVPARPIAAELARTYEQALLFGEHTWGLSGQSVGFRYGDDWRKEHDDGKYARIESSWQEHAKYARTASEYVGTLLRIHSSGLAMAVSIREPHITVFNPLPWKRSDVVSIPLPAGWGATKDAETGHVTAIERKGQTCRFIAVDVPPMGYRTYLPTTDKPGSQDLTADTVGGVIENAFFRVAVDGANGKIVSIVDKKSGRELVDAGADHGFGQYLYERFAKKDVDAFLDTYLKAQFDWAFCDFGKPNLPADTAYATLSPRNFAVQIMADQGSATITMQSPLSVPPHQVKTTITLYSNLPFIELELSILNKAPDPWPEAGWVCLPFKMASPTFRLARPGFMMNPAKDVVPGAGTDLYCLGDGLTITASDGTGVGMCPMDSPLVSLDRPGLWRYSKDFVPQRPRVYVNLFNNMWSTNYPLYVGGTWSSRIRLWAIEAGSGAASLAQHGAEARHQFIAGTGDGNNSGPLPLSQSGIQLSRGGVLITALGANPNGRGMLLRLWEQAGEAGPCKVTLPQQIRSAIVQPCNLRGQPLGSPLPVTNDAFEATLEPFAPASFVIDPG